MRQQNRDILNELSQLKVVTEVHDDRLGQLEALGARAAPAPEAVARPVVLSRLPATTLEELMAAEEAVQDEAVAAALVFTGFFFYFTFCVITHHKIFFSVKLCTKPNYFLTPFLEVSCT